MKYLRRPRLHIVEHNCSSSDWVGLASAAISVFGLGDLLSGFGSEPSVIALVFSNIVLVDGALLIILLLGFCSGLAEELGNFGAREFMGFLSRFGDSLEQGFCSELGRVGFCWELGKVGIGDFDFDGEVVDDWVWVEGGMGNGLGNLELIVVWMKSRCCCNSS